MIIEREYRDRREKLGKELAKKSITVLWSSSYQTRSNDTEFPFRQNSNFYYLTGFKEDNSSLIILKSKRKIKTILFVQKKDKLLELWNGKRLGVKKAKKRFLIDEIYSIDSFDEKIKEYINDRDSFYYDFSREREFSIKLKKELKNIGNHKDISYPIGLMRIIKSAAEIELIQKAIDITALAHKQAVDFNKRDKKEYQLQAELEYIFKKNGAYSDAYSSIVACGNSANTLHYIDNNKPLIDNELILIDAGCEYQYYASDITRTIPVNGVFTLAQQELYNMVLDVQLKIIQMIKPNVKRTDLQKKAVELLTQGMIELNILAGDRKKLIKDQSYKKYYPHGIGHWMGLDVHDEAPYRYKKSNKEILLQKGMVLTIEPGIYIDKNDKDVPIKYRGIGIRIEDDILVTKNGFKNLSQKIGKSVEEISVKRGS